MATWNYRLMKHENDKGEVFYGVHEVYYDENGDIEGWSEESVSPVKESVDELKEELERMMMSFEKEMLDYDMA